MKITTGVASTTHIDKHNQRFAKSALDSMAEQINSKHIPQLIEHDWSKECGTLLYGEVFQLHDGEYALGVVIGMFEHNLESNTYTKGTKNVVSSKYREYLDTDDLKNLLDESNKSGEKDSLGKECYDIVSLLEKHMDMTSVTPDGKVYIAKRFIASTKDLEMHIYPKDHFPPHFHVISNQKKLNARFHIDTLECISTKAGKITEKQKKQIRNFFEDNPEIYKKLKNEYCRLQ